jgi:uncharacterized protein (DUF2236 family)
VASSGAMFGPSSMMWRVNRERVVLLAGPAAAVLQAAHPQVARGVARHSRFREDGLGRLRRTLEAVYRVAFGAADEVEAVRGAVGRAHRAVRGEGYDAFDPGAQRWVLATLVMASVATYRRFVAPLSAAERDALVADYALFGTVFGLTDAPRTWRDFRTYWDAMTGGDELGSDPLCGEVARAVVAPRSPFILRLTTPVLRALSAEMVPGRLRRRLRLEDSRWRTPLWNALDALLPVLLPVAPAVCRFAPSYRRACRTGVPRSGDRP